MLATLIPNPDYKPETAADKAAFEAAKKAGPIKDMAYVTAVENTRHSKGMYAIQSEAKADEVKARELEDMGTEELKVMMAQLGVKTEKQMKRPEVIKAIRIKLAEIDITDE